MFKHLSALVVAIGLTLLGPAFPAMAQKISVVTEEMAPYNFTGNDKVLTGLATDVVKEIFKRAQLDYDIKSYPWARAYLIAQSTPNVAIYSMGRNDEREPMFKWVGTIVQREVYLYKLAARPELKANTLGDVKGMALGGVRAGVRTMYLQKEGLPVAEVTDDSTNLQKLLVKRIDAFPIDEPNLVYLSRMAGVDFDVFEKLLKLDKLSGGLNLAFSLGTPDETVAKARVALEGMHKDGSLKQITARWSTKRK